MTDNKFEIKLSVEKSTTDTWRITWEAMGIKFESHSFDTEDSAIDKYVELLTDLHEKEHVWSYKMPIDCRSS